MRVTIFLALVIVGIIAPATCQRPWWRGHPIKRPRQQQWQQRRPNNQWFQQQDPEAAQEMRERLAEQAEQEAEAEEERREQQLEAEQDRLEQQAEARQQNPPSPQGMQGQDAETLQEMQEQQAEAEEDLREQQAEAAEAQNMQGQQGEAATEMQEQDAEAAAELAEQEAEAAEAEAEAAAELAEQEEEDAEAEAEAAAELAEQEAEAAEELAEQQAEAAEAEAEAREEMMGEAEGGEGAEGAGGSAGTSFSAGGSQYGPSMGGGSTVGSFFDPTGGFGGSASMGMMGGSSYGGYQGGSGGVPGASGGAMGAASGAGGAPGEVPGGGNIGVSGGANGGQNGVANGASNGIPNLAPNGAPNGVPNEAPNGAPTGAANGVPSGAAPNGAANGVPSGAAGTNGTTGEAGSPATAGASQGSTSTSTSSSGTEGGGPSIGTSFTDSTNFGAPNEPNIAFAPAPLAQTTATPLTPEETAALDNAYMDKHLCGGFLGANGLSGKKDLAVLALDYAGLKQALDPCNVPQNGQTTGRTPVNINFRGGMETFGQDPASALLRDLPGMIQRYQNTPKKVHLFSWFMPSEHALRSLLTKKRRGGLSNTEVALGYVEESKMALYSALLGDTTFTNLLDQLKQAGISVSRVCGTCQQTANLTSWQRKRQGLVNGAGVFNQQAGQCGPVTEVPAAGQVAPSSQQCQNFQESMGDCLLGKLAVVCPWLRHAQTANQRPLAAIMESWSTECGKQLSCWQGKGTYLSFLARSAASCGVSQYGASSAIGQCVNAEQNTPLDPPPPTEPSM